MKTLTLILPFLSFILAFTGAILKATFTTEPAFGISAWILAGVCIIAWAALDFQKLAGFFGRKGAKYGASSGAIVVLGVVLALGAAFLSNRARFNKSFDLTKQKLNTLSDESIKVAQKANKTETPIELIAFFDNADAKRQFSDLLEKYETAGVNVNTTYYNPKADIEKAKSYNITQLNQVIIKHNNKESRFSVFNENNMTNELAKIIVSGDNTICFTKGHGEGELRNGQEAGFDYVTEELSNLYKVEQISILEKPGVTNSCSVIVAAGLMSDLLEAEVKFLEDFLKSGKSVLLTVNALMEIPNIKSFTNKHGISVNDDLIITHPQDPRRSQLQGRTIVDSFEPHPITKVFEGNLVAVLASNPRSLSVSAEAAGNFKAEAIAKTSKTMIKFNNIAKREDLADAIAKNDISSNETYTVAAVSVGNVDAGKDKPKLKSKLAVFGAGSFVNNEIRLSSTFGLSLFMNTINFMLDQGDLISIRQTEKKSSDLNLSTQSSRWMLSSIAFLYPCIFFLSGIFFAVRRKQS